MKTQVIFIALGEIFDKLDATEIEHAVDSVSFPEALLCFDTFYLTVVVRPDDLYPQEHYRIGNDLYLTLPLDLDTVRQRSGAEVTDWVKTCVADYLPTIETIEEREMQLIEEDE